MSTFDLTGLPPTPEEVDAFLADDTADAYERLIDRLLASPRYGQRWGRHWLDLVRYAESDGYRQDALRPHAWRYRDYVVRSFNTDKPYDRFLTEQLAGDELDPDDPELRVATGYLRLGTYEYNQRNVRGQWADILNDITDVTGEVFLGLSIGCARCHDHKFDPILQKDYYRLQAFFTPLLPRDDLTLATPRQWADYQAKRAAWEKAAADILRQIDALERPYRDKGTASAIAKFPDEIKAILAKPETDRSLLERQLGALAFRQIAYEHDQVPSLLKGTAKARWDELHKALKRYDALRPVPPDPVLTATDLGPVSPPTVIPGDRKQEPIEPGYLSVLDPGPARIEPSPAAPQSTGRRLALARWLSRPDNPLSTRVIVNRVWQYHFGRGLAGTSSDFGRMGEAPSHPELLDWLATRICRERLAAQASAPPDPDFGGLSPGGPAQRERPRRRPANRSRKPLALEANRPAARRRGDSRRHAGRQRRARSGDRRPERSDDAAAADHRYSRRPQRRATRSSMPLMPPTAPSRHPAATRPRRPPRPCS